MAMAHGLQRAAAMSNKSGAASLGATLVAIRAALSGLSARRPDGRILRRHQSARYSGVMLGGVIAARWGWHAAFGVVGFPGLALALLYLKVRDYRTVELTPTLDQATRSMSDVARHIVRILTRSRTMLWVCIGAAAQLIVVSAVWSWLPSFLNRVHGIAPAQAGVRAALVVLAGAIGSVVWGAVVDRAGMRRSRTKFTVLALLCIATLAALVFAFGAPQFGLALSPPAQFAAHRARRLPDDLHGRAGIRDRHRRHSPRRTRNRMFRTGAVPEPARPRHRAVPCRRIVRRVGSRIGADRHTSL